MWGDSAAWNCVIASVMLPNAKSHAQHSNASSVKLLWTIWAMFVLADAEDKNRLFLQFRHFVSYYVKELKISQIILGNFIY